MELVLSSVTTAAVNLIVFSFLPVLWWFFRHRQAGGFLKWIGFFRPQLKSSWRILLLGAAAVLPALIENFIANGMAEEILYRGFLCKRLCGKTGIVGGIILQAVLFGLMHNILYMAAGLDVGLWYHTLTFLFTGTGAFLLGWLNEKIFNGSIIPSILLHGGGNFLASMLIAFA